MHFIFPQNYDFKTKFLGIIDYSTVFIDVIWFLIIYFMCNFIFSNFNLKVFFIIILFFPFFLISVIGFHGENFMYVLTYLLKFLFSQKLYFFSKY